MTPTVYKCETNVCFQFHKISTALTTIVNSQSQRPKTVRLFQTWSSTSLPDFLLCRVFSDACALGDTKSRVTDSSQSPRYHIRTESEQVSLYSPEQSSLHESEGLLLPSLYILQPSLLLAFSCLSVVPLHWCQFWKQFSLILYLMITLFIFIFCLSPLYSSG